jgi:branched-chain amino acid transport system ATP-binding protein
MLEVEDIHAYYGSSYIIRGVSLRVEKDEVACLLGRNGAGKTTTIKSLMGILPLRKGSVKYNGQQLRGLRPFQIARIGVGYVPEDRRIYPDFTVRENLEIVPHRLGGKAKLTLEEIFDFFPDLKKLEQRFGYQLSGGELQMLAIARALIGNPELMLLDEPTEGLAPLVVSALLESIEKLRKKGRSVLLAEQNARAAIKVSNKVYILSEGIIAFEGMSNEFLENPDLVKKHLLV